MNAIAATRRFAELSVTTARSEFSPLRVPVQTGMEVLGMTTHWAARNIYRVAYDEQTLRLDQEQTRALREEARKERKKRGKPYDEFEGEWLTLRPSDEALEYYGAYPNPKDENKTNTSYR